MLSARERERSARLVARQLENVETESAKSCGSIQRMLDRGRAVLAWRAKELGEASALAMLWWIHVIAELQPNSDRLPLLMHRWLAAVSDEAIDRCSKTRGGRPWLWPLSTHMCQCLQGPKHVHTQSAQGMSSLLRGGGCPDIDNCRPLIIYEEMKSW